MTKTYELLRNSLQRFDLKGASLEEIIQDTGMDEQAILDAIEIGKRSFGGTEEYQSNGKTFYRIRPTRNKLYKKKSWN